VLTVDAKTAEDLPGAFQSALRDHADAMITLNDSLFTANRIRVGELAIENRIPMMHQGIPAVREGGLMTFATKEGIAARLAAGYIDRIIKGEKIGDLPVIVPSEFDLVINMKAAAAIGLKIPESVLAQATQVLQ
jgi:putative ABC transport system substrate-binding protein